jgi:hypothetical protein
MSKAVIIANPIIISTAAAMIRYRIWDRPFIRILNPIISVVFKGFEVVEKKRREVTCQGLLEAFSR